MLSEIGSHIESSAIVSTIVLVSLVAVVAGCGFCRHLCPRRKGNEDEDEETRPLLTDDRRGSSGSRSGSRQTVTFESEEAGGGRDRGTITGNRIVQAEVSAEPDRSQQLEQPAPVPEDELIPDLPRPHEESLAKDTLAEVPSELGPQKPDARQEEERSNVNNQSESIHDQGRLIRTKTVDEDATAEIEAELVTVTETAEAKHDTEVEHSAAEENKLQSQAESENKELQSQAESENKELQSQAESENKEVETNSARVEPEKIEDSKTEETSPAEAEKPQEIEQKLSEAEENPEDTTEKIPETEIASTETKEDSSETGEKPSEAALSQEVHTDTSPQGHPEEEIDFEAHPNFVMSIRTKAAKKQSKPIFGVAVLDGELFVITQHSPDVEVFDANSLEFKHQFPVKDLFDPVDIRSCKRNKCLYIFDWGTESTEIVRIDREGRLIHRWSTDGDGGFLSVMDDGNVILSVWDKNALHEYSPIGQLIWELPLESSITQLRLGSKRNDGLFLISHGEDENSEHRVCIVDETGIVCKSIGGEGCSPESQFDGPNYFAVDRSGAVLVADQNNKRVVILTSDLKFQKELIKETDGLRHPVRLELDQTTGRLFAADNDYLLAGSESNDHDGWRDGRIMVFDFKLRSMS